MTAEINRPASKSLPRAHNRRSREQMHGSTIDTGNRGCRRTWGDAGLAMAFVTAALRRHG
jgi:hypothetical protein